MLCYGHICITDSRLNYEEQTKGLGMGKLMTAAVMLALLAAAGCTRSTNALNINTQSPPQPLPSSPSGSVNSGELDPIAQEQANAQALANSNDPNALSPDGTDPSQSGTEIASLNTQVPESTRPITHDAMAGSWNVNSDSPDCRLILSFTQWSGGYRAATLRCNSQELSSVSAWDIKSNRVVLVDTNGNQVATFASVGEESFSGATSTGKPVSFGR